ncbi:MAG: DUF547 domain-containing protein [Cellulophaga sp.]
MFLKKTLLLSISLLFLSCGNKKKDLLAIAPINQHTIVTQSSKSKKIQHTKWDALLKKHVAENGDVDYKNFKKDISKLDTYLQYLGGNTLSKNAAKEERLAYYINLYNAATIKLILDKYPLKSITRIWRPWGKARIKIGDELYSLSTIEHEVLRKMNEPRIHFAINCASYSCPKLLNEAYTASRLEEQLQKVTINFINDKTKNTYTKEFAKLSKIFKWYEEDFTKNGSLINYINRYKKTTLPVHTKIEYLSYDWSLNEAK